MILLDQTRASSRRDVGDGDVRRSLGNLGGGECWRWLSPGARCLETWTLKHKNLEVAFREQEQST
jgi:hypothetical protein